MTKVQIIEKEVKSLNEQELAEFRGWFQEFDSEAWDAHIEHDVRSGKLDQIAQEALEEHKRGLSKAL
jgi:major membrane immunogen (membrane-anchored lipoprotein)